MTTFQSPFNELYKALENAVENTVPKTKFLELERKYKELKAINDRLFHRLGSAESEKETLNTRCKDLEHELNLKEDRYQELLKSYNEKTCATTGITIKPRTKPGLNVILKKEPVRMMNTPQSLPASMPSEPKPTASKPSTAALMPAFQSQFKAPSTAPVIKKAPLKPPLKPLKPPLKRSAGSSYTNQNSSKIPKISPNFVCPDCYNDWYNAQSDYERSRRFLFVRSFNSHRQLVEHIFEDHPSTATWDTICPEPGCTDQKGHKNEPHGDAFKCMAPDAGGRTCGRTYQNRKDYRFHVNVEHADTSGLNSQQLRALWHADY